MEPFTVTCSTCESRIRVRNPDMVGQLANCPKCASIILIAPPSGTVETPESLRPPSSKHIEVLARDGRAVDSMAVTKDGLAGDLSALAAGSGLEASAQLPTPMADDDYRLAVTEDADANAHTPPPIQGGSASVEGWQESATPLMPSAQWTSSSTHRTRQYLLIAFLGVSGIALAGLSFWGFLRWHSSERVTQAPTVAEPAIPALAEKPNGSSDSTDLGQPVGPESDPDPSMAVSNPSQAPEATQGDVATPSDLASPTPTKAPPLTALPSEGNLAEAAPPGTPTSEPSLSAATVDPDALPATTPDIEPPLSPQLPKQLAPFAPMLSYEIQPQFPDALEVASVAPVTAEDLGLTASTGLPEIPPLDLNVQAQVPVSGLVIGALPAAQFVSLWSNLSGIPTVIDLDTLAAAAIDRRQKLSLSLVQATTMGDILPQLGQALGLRADARENRYLRLAAPSEAMEQKLPQEVALDSLIVDAAGEAWLQAALVQLFPEVDVAWSIADGKLLRPAAADGTPLDPVAWFAVVRMLEGWRLATGQPSTLPQYTPQQLSATLLSSTDVVGLDTKLQQVTAQAHPVAQVLPRVCQEAGIDAWIDWAQVGAVGLGPQSTALFVTTARPLGRVLADYATEFSLVVAILDERSLWITSNQAYRSSPQRYVIANDGRTAEEWKAQLRALTPAASAAGGVGSVVVVPTLDDKFVLVRCCRPVVSF